LRNLYAWLLAACLSLPAAAQESSPAEPASPGFESKWYLGGTYRLDGLGAAGNDQIFGLQMNHRMEPTFGTGASVLFIPKDSSFDINLDARWIWPLPVFEPYIGAQMGYLTRSTGGFSLALRSGVMVELQDLPLQLEFYGLVRYDVFAALWGGNIGQEPLSIGLGTSILYRL